MYPGHHGHRQDGSRLSDGHQTLAPSLCSTFSCFSQSTKVPVELGDEDALEGGVNGPVVERFHQLVLVTTEQVVGPTEVLRCRTSCQPTSAHCCQASTYCATNPPSPRKGVVGGWLFPENDRSSPHVGGVRLGQRLG